jgi:hypothetical protein
LAKRFGIGKDAIARVWADHNLKPWRVDNFKLSNDPHFEEKLSAVKLGAGGELRASMSDLATERGVAVGWAVKGFRIARVCQ